MLRYQALHQPQQEDFIFAFAFLCKWSNLKGKKTFEMLRSLLTEQLSFGEMPPPYPHCKMSTPVAFPRALGRYLHLSKFHKAAPCL